MARRFWGHWRPVVAGLVLVVLAGCSSKKESESDSSGGGSDTPPAKGEPGLPPSPATGTVVTAYYGLGELAQARRDTESNLRNIGLAHHAFHDVMGHLAVGTYDPSGKKLGLSWRVLILPYIEQDGLYKEFKLDEPWDSDHNKKLIPRMPKTYAPPGSRVAKGYTYYRTFTGPEAVTPPPQPMPPPQPGQGPRFARGRSMVGITDGTSNTILVAEAADPVIWTKPDELEYDAKKPPPKLGGVFEDGFYALICDGSVRFWRKSTPEKVLRAAITATGGEVVQLP